ncbi:centrosomal protein 20 isoform X2 [Cavia porcellus]|uniref:centrosomal protein 20 isoform X2 n=1 Tax=Cavia porcellus TaxID=10141 RepID=UPI002FE39880
MRSVGPLALDHAERGGLRVRKAKTRPKRPLKMATVAELKAVLKDTLEKKGVLGHLKARIRAEVFNALDDDREPRPPLSHENLLINELIREYLEFNKYKYTASVLIAAGQPVDPLDRQFLIRELNAFEESKDNTIPLLYGILAHFLHGNKDGIQNTFLKEASLQPPNLNLGSQPSGRKQADGHLEKERGTNTNIEELHVSQTVKR